MNSVVFVPCRTTTRSAINFASRVAVAVAVGTPGIGNDTTGFPPSHTTDVLPAVATSAGTWAPGLTENIGGSWVPASADLSAPCGLAQRRIIRSSVAAAIGVALPFPLMSSAPGIPSRQEYAPLSTSMLEDACHAVGW